MKHLTTILAAILVLVAFVGAGLNIYYAINNNKDYICNADYRGHSYVLVHADGSTGITHDPDCPCQYNRYAKNTHDNPDTPVAMETRHAPQTKAPRHMLADTVLLNQFHQASERAAAEATAETADARRRAMGFSPKPTEGGEK